MCIIIAKDKIGRLPKEKELKNAFEYNDDGAGFMYVDNGKVVIDKGYMTFESFMKHYKTLLNKYDNFKNKSLVIHCRIGTSGRNTKGNTHPYPITNKTKKLRNRHLSREDIGIAHNGIIKGYGTATGLNDTQEYISKYLYPLYTHYKDFYKNKDMLYQMEKATNSKFAILDTDDNIYYVGDFIDDNGLNFSNDTYLENWYSYNYGTNNWYDSMYNKQKLLDSKIDDEDDDLIDYTGEYLIPLESEWHIDLYGSGNVEKVGDRVLWYDYETMELLQEIGGEMETIALNPIIYDENNKEIF